MLRGRVIAPFAVLFCMLLLLWFGKCVEKNAPLCRCWAPRYYYSIIIRYMGWRYKKTQSVKSKGERQFDSLKCTMKYISQSDTKKARIIIGNSCEISNNEKVIFLLCSMYLHKSFSFKTKSARLGLIFIWFEN